MELIRPNRANFLEKYSRTYFHSKCDERLCKQDKRWAGGSLEQIFDLREGAR